jgi:hypothetical protein
MVVTLEGDVSYEQILDLVVTTYAGDNMTTVSMWFSVTLQSIQPDTFNIMIALFKM